ncbi:glycosyltransferase family 4 protein [Schlesneria sp. DSM 10557]|uniref:glycosyltransferase family 4 protein n=1 Tax=Schlesneria sp. DSM 10557 TaxID=3044399 RepID=UPI0035A0BC2B
MMPVRRIALIFEFNTLNGGERSMLAALDWLKTHRPDLEFHALGPSTGRLAEALRSRFIPLHHWSVRDPAGNRLTADRILSELLNGLGKIKPDLVHANSLSMSRLLGPLRSRLEVPTTGHLRDIIKLSRGAIDDLNLNDRLIAVSHATRNFHLQQGLREQLVNVVHNGIDCGSETKVREKRWLLDELQLSPAEQSRCEERIRQNTLRCSMPPTPDARILSTEPLLITCIGQIGLRKGLDVVAAAALRITQKRPDVHFLMIGERTSQKAESVQFESSLRQRIAEDGVSSHVHWLGHRDDVPRILRAVDLLVHPANQEPFGRVLLEASAAGLPIVATDVGGTSEIVLDGQTGVLVPPRDPVALAEAVASILSNPSEAQRMGAAARERTAQLFSSASSAQHLAQIWDSVLRMTRGDQNA